MKLGGSGGNRTPVRIRTLEMLLRRVVSVRYSRRVRGTETKPLLQYPVI